MRAVRAHRRGGPEQLAVDAVPVPAPGRGEILVEVHAVAITFAELTWDETWIHAPATVGHEFSGVVTELGADVDGFEMGDEVFGLVRFDRQGAAADYVTVPAADVALKPSSLTHVQTAALPLAALTAWQGLVDVAQVRATESILVLGGAGGVGAFVVQLARHLGLRVTATARRGGVALLGELGVETVVNTDVEAVPADSRFDVVFDTVGGDALDGAYDLLVRGGRLVTLQAPPDQRRAEHAQVRASFFVVSPDAKELSTLAGLAADGTLRTVIAATFPLESGRVAFETGGSPGHAPGKTVLIVRDDEQ